MKKELELSPNQVVAYLEKDPKEFTREDLQISSSITASA